MSIKSDRWIRRMAKEFRMIEPFADRQVRDGVISYGVSSYGYDMRVAPEFKIFTNALSAVVDPKHFDPKTFVEFTGGGGIVPPNSFALRSEERRGGEEWRSRWAPCYLKKKKKRVGATAAIAKLMSLYHTQR